MKPNTLMGCKLETLKLRFPSIIYIYYSVFTGADRKVQYCYILNWGNRKNTKSRDANICKRNNSTDFIMGIWYCWAHFGHLFRFKWFGIIFHRYPNLFSGLEPTVRLLVWWWGGVRGGQNQCVTCFSSQRGKGQPSMSKYGA